MVVSGEPSAADACRGPTIATGAQTCCDSYLVDSLTLLTTRLSRQMGLHHVDYVSLHWLNRTWRFLHHGLRLRHPVKYDTSSPLATEGSKDAR